MSGTTPSCSTAKSVPVRPYRVAAQLVMLVRHLERDLHRGRARVGEEDAGEPARDEPRELLGALDGGGRGEAEQGRVGDPPELRADGLVDLRDAVAVDVAPERGNAVEVAVPERVDEVRAVARVDDERLLREPVLHLRERVPQVPVVRLAEPAVALEPSGVRHSLRGACAPRPPRELESSPREAT